MKFLAPLAGVVVAALGYFTPVLQPLLSKYPWLGPVLAGIGLVAGSLAPQPQKS